MQQKSSHKYKFHCKTITAKFSLDRKLDFVFKCMTQETNEKVSGNVDKLEVPKV